MTIHPMPSMTNSNDVSKHLDGVPTRRSLLSLVLRTSGAGVLGAGLLGCDAGRNLTGQMTDVAPPGRLRAGTTLTLTHFYGATQLDNIQRRVALFEQDTPGLRVDAMQLPGAAAYREKLLAMFAGDSPPDVMHMSAAPGSGYSFGVFAPLGRFFELAPLARRDRYDLDDFYKVAIDFNSLSGKLYVMPNDLNVFATYWSQELFRRGGATPPPTDWRSAAFDQQALLDTAKRLTDRSGSGGTERFGLLIQPNVQWLLPFLWSNGADVVSADLRRITLDAPPALDTLQFLADMADKHKVTPANEELAASGGGPALFFAGRLAIHHTGSNFVNQLRTQAKDLSWDVAVSPRGRTRRASIAGGAGFAGATQSKARDEAWALLKHLGSKPSLEIGAREGQMPTRRSVARSEAFLDPNQPPVHRRVFLDAAENAGPNPMVTNWHEVEAAINKALTPLFAGQRSVREAVAEAKQQGDPLLAAGHSFTR
jgi:multiple sugar transport system substrate-binding protein